MRLNYDKNLNNCLWKKFSFKLCIILNILDNKKDTSLFFYQLSKYILKYSISNKEVLDYDERTFYDDPKLCKDDLNLISSAINELLKEGKIEIDFIDVTSIKFKIRLKFIKL